MAIEKRHGHPARQGEAEVRTDFEAVLDHVRDNPLLYVAAIVFTIVVVVAGVLYYSAAEVARKDMATAYMEALLIEDPAERAAELTRVAGELRGEFAAEALYMAAESYYRAGDQEQARPLYERVRAEHAGSPFVAPATEGLAYIHQEQGDASAAMALFREVQNSHPESFEARRQWYNLARASEGGGELEQAIEYYTNQIDAFPGSSVAQQAQAALDRLRREHAELFPEDFVLEMPGAPGLTLDAPLGFDDLPPIELQPVGEAPAEFSIEPPAAELEAEDIPAEIELIDPATGEPVDAEAEAADAEDAEDAEAGEVPAE